MKKLLKYIFSKTGIHVVKKQKFNGSTSFVINNLSYDAVLPASNYSPWNADAEFLKIYSSIKSFTLVDKYRAYELWQLTEHISRVNPSAAFIEIGVWRGGTSAVIGKKLSLIKSKIDFFLADTFTGVVKSSENDTFYFDKEHNDTSEEMVNNLLKDKYHKFQILKGIFPEETSHLVSPDTKFGFCHIDVDVYNSAKDIVDWIWDKMIVGGVIVFDDYGFYTCDGVTKYVNEQRDRGDCMIIHNLNGHALMIKL